MGPELTPITAHLFYNGTVDELAPYTHTDPDGHWMLTPEATRQLLDELLPDDPHLLTLDEWAAGQDLAATMRARFRGEEE